MSDFEKELRDSLQESATHSQFQPLNPLSLQQEAKKRRRFKFGEWVAQLRWQRIAVPGLSLAAVTVVVLVVAPMAVRNDTFTLPAAPGPAFGSAAASELPEAAFEAPAVASEAPTPQAQGPEATDDVLTRSGMSLDEASAVKSDVLQDKDAHKDAVQDKDGAMAVSPSPTTPPKVTREWRKTSEGLAKFWQLASLQIKWSGGAFQLSDPSCSEIGVIKYYPASDTWDTPTKSGTCGRKSENMEDLEWWDSASGGGYELSCFNRSCRIRLS